MFCNSLKTFFDPIYLSQKKKKEKIPYFTTISDSLCNLLYNVYDLLFLSNSFKEILHTVPMETSNLL